MYDINNVLEEARKNRQEKDDLEEKRKLKNQSYNILSNLNKEELEKCRQERLDKVIASQTNYSRKDVKDFRLLHFGHFLLQTSFYNEILQG